MRNRWGRTGLEACAAYQPGIWRALARCAVVESGCGQALLRELIDPRMIEAGPAGQPEDRFETTQRTPNCQ